MNAILSLVLGLLVVGLIWSFFIKPRRFGAVAGGVDRTKTIAYSKPVELYSNSFSHCSRKARLVLAELGIEAQHHPIDLIETGWYQTVSPAYLQVNPSGVVPTLVHNGHPVYESDDILNYAQAIADEGAPQLVPDDPQLEGKMQDWLHFCAIVSADLMGGMKERAGACIPGLTMPIFITSIQYVPLPTVLKGFLTHFTFKSPALFTTFKLLGLRRVIRLEKLAELIHNSRDHMSTHLETFNQTLKAHGEPWILGSSYSLADVSIGCLLLRLEETGWLSWFAEKGQIAEVLDYYERIKARPAWTQAITDHAHPIVTKASADLMSAKTADPALAEAIYGAPR
ncbi:MAG: glutathione S-transferase family protein [Pseudomonadota bacterium]